METITLKYDPKNQLIKRILNSAMLAVAKVEGKEKFKGIDESMNEIKENRIYRAKSVKDLMKKV